MNIQDAVPAFIADIMTAISNCMLYNVEHPAVGQHAGRAVHVLEALYADDLFSLALLGDSLIVNGKPCVQKSIHITNFIRKLRRQGIDRIAVSRGVTAAEMQQFISELALSDKLAGGYPHIVTGTIEVKLGGGSAEDLSVLMRENTEKVKGVLQGASRFKRLDMVGLEDVVVNFIATLRQEANILKVLSPVKAYSEYTYAHNTNVSVLAIFQAETLGFRKELLHEIGLAGLLHDVGKMFVSKEVLEKEGKLSGAEWEEMRKHPVYGAVYLATLPEVPKYALIAAYEHDMKFNGGGYPEPRRKGPRQHIVSQIISIADFFDALRTDRPYRRPVETDAIIGLMTELSGKEFNPLLVENFIRAMRRISPSAA